MNKKFLSCLLICLIILPCFLVIVGCANNNNNNNNINNNNTNTNQSVNNNNNSNCNTIPSTAYGDLPLVKINTENNITPFDKENYINCSFEITNCENSEHNLLVTMKETYDYDKEDGGVGVRLRGNTTMFMPKKPYRIKFEKKKSLFGLPKAKSWVLLADYIDQSKIKNYSALTLGNEVFTNLNFTAHPTHVILEFNGEYKGVYLLCEQMDEKEGRTNVEIDKKSLYTNYTKTEFPFLIEMDVYAQDDKTIAEADKLLLEGYYPIEIKYPESKDRGTFDDTDLIYNYITEYLNAVKITLSTGEKISVSFRPNPVGFEDLVDVKSLIDYNLLNEFMYNTDSLWKSCYMHKTINKVDPETNEIIEYGKLAFGPIWDFDWAISGPQTSLPSTGSFVTNAQQIKIFNSSIFFNNFLKKQSNFELVQSRWNEISINIKNVSTNLRDYKKHISEVSKFDALLWYGERGDFEFDTQYDCVRLFILDRIDFFNKIFNLQHDEFLLKTNINIS